MGVGGLGSLVRAMAGMALCRLGRRRHLGLVRIRRQRRVVAFGTVVGTGRERNREKSDEDEKAHIELRLVEARMPRPIV